MSIWFGKKNKKIISAVWTGLAILIIASMLLLYTPLFI